MIGDLSNSCIFWERPLVISRLNALFVSRKRGLFRSKNRDKNSGTDAETAHNGFLKQKKRGLWAKYTGNS